MRTPISLLVILACTLASACGNGGPGDVDSGLPNDKKGSELTDSEATTLCEANADNLAGRNSSSEQKRFACILVSASSGGDDPVGFCKSFVPMCVDAPPEDGDGEPTKCLLPFDTTTCEASIADIEACLSEQNEAIGAGISDLSCDDLDDAPGEPTTGPACTKAKADCPGIA